MIKLFRKYKQRKLEKEAQEMYNKCVRVAKLEGYKDPERSNYTSRVTIIREYNLVKEYKTLIGNQLHIESFINTLKKNHPDAIDFEIKRYHSYLSYKSAYDQDSYTISKVIPVTDEDYKDICERHFKKWQSLQREIETFNTKER